MAGLVQRGGQAPCLQRPIQGVPDQGPEFVQLVLLLLEGPCVDDDLTLLSRLPSPAADRDPQHIQASLWTELAEPTYDGSVPAARTSVAFRWHWFEPKDPPPASAQDEKSCVFKVYPRTVKLLPTSESVYETSDDYILVTFFASEPR